METMALFIFLICLVIFAPLVTDLIVYRIKTRKTHSGASLFCNTFFDGPDLEAGVAPANPSPCLFFHPLEGGDEYSSVVCLNGCSFCRKQLRPDKDVFFYSDMRFCGQECRIEKIEIDDAKEKDKRKNKKGEIRKLFTLLV